MKPGVASNKLSDLERAGGRPRVHLSVSGDRAAWNRGRGQQLAVWYRRASCGACKIGVCDMKMLITAGLLPVLAFQCPADMAAIDAALETANLSEADLARVKEQRATGEADHAAGNHQASADALAEVKKLLGIDAN